MQARSSAPSIAVRGSAALRCRAPFVGFRHLINRFARCHALKDAASVPVMQKGELSEFPGAPGVYAVYDKAGALQYIGLSRKVGKF